MGTESNDSNLFPLDINDNSLNSNNVPNNVTNANKNDDVVIFPLDITNNFRSTNTNPNNNNTQSVATSTNLNISKGKISKPKNTPKSTKNNNQNSNQQTGQGIPSQKKTSKSISPLVKWIVILLLFFYFKKDIFNSRAFHKIERWFVLHNPFETNINDFENFKKGKPIYYADHPNIDPTHWFKKTNTTYDIYIGELILLGKTGEIERRYVLPKGVKEEMYYSVNKNKKTKNKIYIREIDYYIEELLLNNEDLGQKALLQEWQGGPTFYVSINKLEYYQEVALKFLKNDFDAYKKNDTGIIFIPECFYERIKKGENVRNLTLKDIPTFKITENTFNTSHQASENSKVEQKNNSEEVLGLTPGRSLYKVKSSSLGKSFFYESPDYSSKTKKYIIAGDLVQIENTENGFGFTNFYNNDEVQTDGWLDMSTLEFQCKDCDIKR